MKKVGVREARTKLSSLLDQVEQGGTIVITRHGKPVARLLPIEARRPDVSKTIAAIRESRTGNSLGGLSVRDLIEEGRRF